MVGEVLFIMNCFVCERIDLAKQGKNPYLVKELRSGYVFLCDYQFFKGYTIFSSKIHVSELHKLGKKQRKLFLEEMALVAEAVIKVFKPKKLNYELLGNSESHLHWHLIPRYKNDPNPKHSIWTISKEIRENKKYLIKGEELELVKNKLSKELEELLNC